jgi:hypothetical protein
MESIVYNINEVSTLLNLSQSKVRELIKQGKLKKLPIDKPIRVAQCSVDEFLGIQAQAISVKKDNEVVLEKKEIMNLISYLTEIQQITNKLLILFHNKIG